MSRWLRSNYRGRRVDLRGGVALWAYLGAVAAGSGGSARQRLGALIAVGLAGGSGLHDDAGDGGGTKGLKGHLGALRQGRVTPGLVKMGAIGLGAGVNALLTATPGKGKLARVVLDTALVAGLANLINLLDLRPGRALKGAGLVALGGLTGQGRQLAGGVLAAEAAVAKGDLSERTMLGDTGANALGAAVGVAVGRSWPVAIKLAAVGGIVGLILASERVSFTKVIAANAALRRVDLWGRSR